MAIELLKSENPAELWAKKEVRKDLKKFINYKNITMDENGKVAGKSSKRNCVKQLFHKFKMRSTSSKYFLKQLNIAIIAYNKQALEKIDAQAKVTFVDAPKIQEQVNAEQKKIQDADVLLAQNVKAKGDLLAPLKARQEALASTLTQVGISADDVKTIIAKKKEIDEHSKKETALVKEEVELNAENETLEAKYPYNMNWGVKGIKYFKVKGDKEASIKGINDDNRLTPKEKEALTKDVSKVIDNDVRIAEIPNDARNVGHLKTDLNNEIKDLVKAAVATPEGKTWNDCVALYNIIEAMENNEAHKVAISAIDAQINAANVAKAAANAQIAKLNDQLPKDETPVAQV